MPLCDLPVTFGPGCPSILIKISPPSFSAFLACNKDFMAVLVDLIPALILYESTSCEFSLLVPLNFNSCCAATQAAQYKEDFY